MTPFSQRSGSALGPQHATFDYPANQMTSHRLAIATIAPVNRHTCTHRNHQLLCFKCIYTPMHTHSHPYRSQLWGDTVPVSNRYVIVNPPGVACLAHHNTVTLHFTHKSPLLHPSVYSDAASSGLL